MDSGFDFANFIMTMIMLVLGDPSAGNTPNMQPNMSLKAYADAPVYVELNMRKLKDYARSNGELMQMLYQGQNPQTAYAEALNQLQQQSPIDVDKIKNIVGNIERIGFWMFAPGDVPHVLVVLEHSSSDTAFANPLMEISKDYTFLRYADAPVHFFRERNADGLWLTEIPGKIAIGYNPFAVKSFLMKAQKLASANIPSSLPDNSIIKAEAQAQLLHQIIGLLRRYDREEFFIFSSFVDLPAWEKLSVSVSETSLEVSLKLDENSEIGQVIASPQSFPDLLNIVDQDTPVAGVLSLKDPLKLWHWLKKNIQMAEYIDRGKILTDEKMKEEVFKETGLDIEQDIFGNIREMAYIVPKLEKERDLEKNMILMFKVDNPPKAREALAKMMEVVMRGKSITETQIPGGTRWDEQYYFTIAIQGNTVVFAPNYQGKAFVSSIIEKMDLDFAQFPSEIRQAHPNATSFFVVNPQAISPELQKIGTTSAGLSFNGQELKLRVLFDTQKILGTVLETMK